MLQTWCSLYIVWYLLSLKKTVIYEVSEAKNVYIIRSDGSMRIQPSPAASSLIPEMGVFGPERAVHVYDASAKANSEPAQSNAFLILTSSRNTNNYAQSGRRNILRCVIPSYTLEELALYSETFGLNIEELTARCFEIGPSFRYIIADNNFAQTKVLTEAKAKGVSAGQMDRYIDNNNLSGGDSRDISACLVKAIVREEEFEDPDEAYLDRNVVWEIASQKLCRIILETAESGATNFIRNFITEVDFRGLTRLKGICGNYFELVLEDYLKKGTFQNYRFLSEPGATEEVSGKSVEIQLFEQCDQVSQRTFVDIPTALLACGTPDKDKEFFSFCKSFPAIDFATAGFSVCFQATTSESHAINFDAISAVCEHVRQRFGDFVPVHLVFVVPDKKVFSKWMYTQSYTYTDEVMEAGMNGEEVLVKRKRQMKYAKLSHEMQMKVANLKQMVIYVYE